MIFKIWSNSNDKETVTPFIYIILFIESKTHNNFFISVSPKLCIIIQIFQGFSVQGHSGVSRFCILLLFYIFPALFFSTARQFDVSLPVTLACEWTVTLFSLHALSKLFSTYMFWNCRCALCYFYGAIITFGWQIHQKILA